MVQRLTTTWYWPAAEGVYSVVFPIEAVCG